MTTLDGNPASKLVYLAKFSDKELKYTELVSIKDDMRYSVLFATDVNAYDHYAPISQKMIDSIKLTTPMY